MPVTVTLTLSLLPYLLMFTNVVQCQTVIM